MNRIVECCPFKAVRRKPSQSTVGAGNLRTGAVLVIAMICLLMATVIVASLAQTTIVQRERVIRDEWQLQAEWLAESALDRAVVRSREADYAGETWKPALDGESIGTVLITVERAEDAQLMITVVADVPDRDDERVRVRKAAAVAIAEPPSMEETP